MNYCSHCGAKVELRIPVGDNRERHICIDCETIHYQNPRIITGCLPEWEDQVLLCRRAIEPREGYWTMPAGFMENGETVHDGASRETLEEADAKVEMRGLFTLFNIPYANQVFMIHLARLLDLDFGPGEESLEVALFAEHEIPWDELAFPMVEETLRLYFLDKKAGSFGTHAATVVRLSRQPRRYRIDLH
ncbi:FAD pyrophosphatase [hydrothermal vent metagenome]|uniref:FAD pyrophosphatase n=1 Tax=hydrothermal vent metagenome TaxID=652676 RepID=A0A3B1BAB1_9ZZZZ